MYISNLCGDGCIDCEPCRAAQGLSGVGFLETLLSTATGAFASGAGRGLTSGGGGAVMPMMPNVNVNTSTQVSPQISPNFIQQDEPVDSAVNASTYSAPSGPYMPVTSGPIPGAMNIPGTIPVSQPIVPAPVIPTPSGSYVSTGGDDTQMWYMFGGLALIGALVVSKRKKRV